MKHTLRNTFGQNAVGALFAYVLLDFLMLAAGMGVPVFCVLLGVAVGWFGARRAEYFLPEPGPAMRRVVRYAMVCAGTTAALLLGLWAPLVPRLLSPDVDLYAMGLPSLPGEPRLSAVLLLALLIVVTPLLQFLAVLGGAYLTFMRRLRNGRFGSGRL